MTHQTSSTSHRGSPHDGVFASIGLWAPQKPHNISYGKSIERYQYVTTFFAKSHGRSLVHPEPCETLLRNRQVMQQGYAC